MLTSLRYVAAFSYRLGVGGLFANILVPQAACLAKLREDTTAKPDFQDFDDSGPATGTVSSVGTPLANGQNGGTKLKLTFNKGGGSSGGGGLMNGTNGESDDD